MRRLGEGRVSPLGCQHDLSDVDRWVVVGGAGFIGSRTAAELVRQGQVVTVIDRVRPPESLLREGVTWIEMDLLEDPLRLPPGRLVLAYGSGNSRPRWTWTIPLEIVFTTARLAEQLDGREVTLLSSVEVYGRASGTLSEDTEPELPWDRAQLATWAELARRAACVGACPPWRVAGLCREMISSDPPVRWVYGAAKLVQEMIVRASGAASLTILRLTNAYGLGQERVVMRLIRRALADLTLAVTDSARSFVSPDEIGRFLLDGPAAGTFNFGGPAVRLAELAHEIVDITGSRSKIDIRPQPIDDSSGDIDVRRLLATGFSVGDVTDALPRLVTKAAEQPPMFRPELPIVIPPRPARPDVVADRQQECLWRGLTKTGNRYSAEARERLAGRLGVAPERVYVTTSGTEALRIGVIATAGPARPGDVAVVPSFTYPATAEAMAQLGYEVRFVEVDLDTYTIDARDLERNLARGDVRVVVPVDTFGNPIDYRTVVPLCRRYGVPVVADSAAAFGARTAGELVGSQADAHAFSMSFAKALTAGGAGGAVVVPADAELGYWTRSNLMPELPAVSLVDQLDIFDDLLERRLGVARHYAEATSTYPWLRPQSVRPGDRHAYVHWVVRVPIQYRGSFRSALGDLGVATGNYFQALHRTGWASERPLPATSQLHDEAVALPMSSEMTTDDAERVVAAMHHVLAASTEFEPRLEEAR